MPRLVLCLWLLLVAGCGLWHPPVPETPFKPLDGAERTALVQALVGAINPAFPPAKTHLVVRPLDGHEALVEALTQTLREVGYGVTTETTAGAHALSWSLDEPVANQLYVQLGVGTAYQWTRLYERRGSAGLEPLSGPTVRRE